MGSCQSRPSPKDSVQKSDKSVFSGSGASASTVAVSNKKQQSQRVVEDDYEFNKIREGEPEAVKRSFKQPEPANRPQESTPNRRRIKANPLSRFSSPGRRSPKRERTHGNQRDPPAANDEFTESSKSVEPRKLWFSPSKTDTNEPDDDEYMEDVLPQNIAEATAEVDSYVPKEASSEKGNGKRSTKSRKMGFAPIRTSIPEEEDPEMPSDEEDFQEDLKRNTPKEEPGRLVPIKLRSQPTTSVASVLVAGGNETPSKLAPGDKSSVHMQTFSEFQRLKLQVKLQKHQEMKDRKVTKVEERINDAESNKSLWLEYQKAEQELARLEQDGNLSKARALRRTDSFDLKDSSSWFFDFQTARVDPVPDEHDDDASQGNLSLLSEQSLDAQRRFYAEKRRKRKERKKQSKLEKRLQKDAEALGMNDPSRQSPGQLIRSNSGLLNMGNSVSSGFTNDYGPVRDGPPRSAPAPFELEVSFQHGDGYASDLNDNKGDDGSYVGSYVSDLGDESYTGGGWGGSQAGQSYSQYTYGSASNDYGVKRRARRSDYSTKYGDKDRESIQDKLKALESKVAQMKTNAEEEDTPKAGSLTARKQLTSKPSPTLQGGALTALPLEQLVDKFEQAHALPSEKYSVVAESDVSTPMKASSTSQRVSVHSDETNKGDSSLITPTASPSVIPASLPNSEDSMKSDFAILRGAATASSLLQASLNTPDVAKVNSKHAIAAAVVSPDDDDDDSSAATGPRQFYNVREVQPASEERFSEEKKESEEEEYEKLDIVEVASPAASVPISEAATPPPFETPPATNKSDSSFWSSDLDNFLLKNIIPERTNATPDETVPENRVSGKSFWTEDLFSFIPERTNIIPDESEGFHPKSVVAVTPGTTCTTPTVGEIDEQSDDESPEAHLARRILQSSTKGRHLPDPDGKRIDASESLRLAGEVEAQVAQVLTNFREVDQTKVGAA
mmetsp:Transcript_12553/g.25993  ORF Transcript_12553/g.25993 Transcript_12553/m.25993 type:complete len:955 (-) Transcript_12553:142-3006(-)|eukprot:CAMPEP_0172452452 /NCGR_PEP_ID=MMETSP1065-20121228/10110_1 /TAXON_ID=265537 /ORGANISM="Amphiprora paludosa, Strain CCMP125" /LENGTH=954 /DNA_ID=CAMNT_0013204507 /DNA_START=95 /DNA_END=2959 /DNA_ORIENTATION=+